MESALNVDPNFLHSVGMRQLCLIHLKRYQQLDEFLVNHPLAEKADECRALYHLIHPDEEIDIDLKKVGTRVEEAGTVGLFPWELFLQVHLGNHQLALDMLETAVNKKTGQYINFKNTPLLKPLHAYPRFQKLVQTNFHPSLLPKEPLVGSGDQKASRPLMDAGEQEQALGKLDNAMQEEQLYTDPSISLRDLADHLDIHPNKLSWLLNEHVGKNFNEFLNFYRLETFKEKALDPGNSHLTILGLAFESGFNSKTVFNAFFKRMEGMTPRAWMKAQ